MMSTKNYQLAIYSRIMKLLYLRAINYMGKDYTYNCYKDKPNNTYISSAEKFVKSITINGKCTYEAKEKIFRKKDKIEVEALYLLGDKQFLFTRELDYYNGYITNKQSIGKGDKTAVKLEFTTYLNNMLDKCFTAMIEHNLQGLACFKEEYLNRNKSNLDSIISINQDLPHLLKDNSFIELTNEIFSTTNTLFCPVFCDLSAKQNYIADNMQNTTYKTLFEIALYFYKGYDKQKYFSLIKFLQQQNQTELYAFFSRNLVLIFKIA